MTEPSRIGKHRRPQSANQGAGTRAGYTGKRRKGAGSHPRRNLMQEMSRDIKPFEGQ